MRGCASGNEVSFGNALIYAQRKFSPQIVDAAVLLRG